MLNMENDLLVKTGGDDAGSRYAIQVERVSKSHTQCRDRNKTTDSVKMPLAIPHQLSLEDRASDLITRKHIVLSLCVAT